MSVDSFHAAADREIDRLEKAVAERDATIAALRAALSRYGWHAENCNLNRFRQAAGDEAPCNCGLDALFKDNPTPGADLLARRAEAERERDALKAQVAELRADKERLDWWLAHQWVRFTAANDKEWEVRDVAPGGNYGLGNVLGSGKSKREAIDAAMERSR